MSNQHGRKRRTVKKILSTLSPLTSGKEQIRKELEVSERKYKTAFEYTGTGMLIIEEDMTISLINQRICEMTGYSHEEIEGNKKWTDIVSVKDVIKLTEFHKLIKMSPDSKPTEYEFQYRHKNGSTRDSLLIVSMIPGSTKSLISMLDITEQKKMEGDLRESEKRFKETAELLPSIICEFDQNMKFIYTNKAGLKSFGFTQEEFETGITIDKLVVKEDFERAKQNLTLIMTGKTYKPQEYRLRHKDGTIRDYFVTSSPIIKEGSVVGVRSCVFDISDRKRVEIQLKESEERLRSIFAASPIGIATFERNGNFIEINQSFKTLFGLPENVDSPRIRFTLFHYLDKIKISSIALVKGKGVGFETDDDFKFVKNNELYEMIPMNKRIFEWQITPLCIESGYARYFLAQVQDITERKKREKAKLSKAQKLAEDANRMVEGLRKEINKSAHFYSIVSRSPAMQEIFNILPEIAQTSTTVLITGESGTGKELIAKSIHKLGPRKSNRFNAINCGALPDNLLESELFGYKAGAFTDAKKDKPGKFEQAHMGTLFLDEIGDISPAMQVKLLRVLQERTIEPLGSTESIPIDVHVIAATNKNLPEMVKKGEFREDLYYRIKVLNIFLPPLRDRKLDIPLLCDHFISVFNARYKKNITELSSKSLNLLLAHDYPGNIRELENILEHSFIFCKGDKIEPPHLPSEIVEPYNTRKKDDILTGIKSFDELERMFIKHILRETGGSKIKAAEKLGIHKATLFRKIKNLGIEDFRTD